MIPRFLISVCLVACTLPPAWAQPEVQSWTADSGAHVLFVSTDVLPMIDVRVVFDAGAARDGDSPGLAALTSRLLSAGTQAMDEDAVATAFESVGANFGSGSARDMAWVDLRVLSDPAYREPAVALMADLLASPAFPMVSFERERSRALSALDALNQSPDAVAELTFYAAVYGDHPYGSPPQGTVESLSTMAVADLKAFHQRFYVAANATVAIVGDLDRPQAEALAAGLTNGLPQGDAPPALPPVPSPQVAGETLKVPFPSSQAHVYIGQAGVTNGEPDLPALKLGNQLLGGGGLVSALSQAVREERGLSYSIYSTLVPMRSRGPFFINLQTQGATAQEAVDVSMATLRQLLRDGPDPEVLERARNNLVRGFPQSYASNGKLVDFLAAIGFYDLPLDYLAQQPQVLQEVPIDGVTDAMRSHIQPDDMVTVIVGG